MRLPVIHKPVWQHGISLVLCCAVLVLGSGEVQAAEAKKKTTTSQPAAKKTAASSSKKKTQPRTPASNQKKAAPAAKTTTPVVSTREMQSTRKDLDSVSQQIREAQKTLRLTQAERDQKEAELKKAEVQIGGIKKELRATSSEVDQRRQALTELGIEKREKEASKQRQIAQLKKDVEAGYRRGGQDYFKLFLNQEQPQLAARQLKYYAYIQQARSELIRELDNTLAELARIEQEEKQNLAKLDVLQDKLEKQQQELATVQEQRSKALTVLNAQVESQDEQLKRLRRDQAALQSVMQKLEQQAREEARREAARKAEEARLAKERERREREQALKEGREPPKVVAKPAEKTTDESWGSEPDYSSKPYTGKCALPVAGGIRSSFGSPRAGGLRWNGVLIAAPAGASVKAVKAGKVVYADYLRGYGFLVIIDHGKGLMSLYGQNQSLLKSVGDTVAANENIALAGSSGGNEDAGLYFEIRLRGRPSNPVAWCSY